MGLKRCFSRDWKIIIAAEAPPQPYLPIIVRAAVQNIGTSETFAPGAIT